MINTVILEKLISGSKAPDTLQAVSAYDYNAADISGSPPNGTKIADMTEISGAGLYTIDLVEAKKVTIVVGGTCRAGLIGILFNGDKALDDSVDTSALSDSAVTPVKTTFAY